MGVKGSLVSADWCIRALLPGDILRLVPWVEGILGFLDPGFGTLSWVN